MSDSVLLGRSRGSLLITLAVLCTLVPSVSTAQRSTATAVATLPNDSAEVLVTRDEVRVRFPAERDSIWSWPNGSRSVLGGLRRWIATIPTPSGDERLAILVQPRDLRPRTFTGLEALLNERMDESRCRRQGTAEGPCILGPEVSSSVEGRRLVLTVRDTAAIARMFALRPARVQLLIDPWDGRRLYLADAPVRYLRPSLPPLDSAERRRVVEDRRRWEASNRRMTRFIWPRSRDGVARLAPGDSLTLGIAEFHCWVDFCMPFVQPRSAASEWGTWVVEDSSVARIHPVDSAADVFTDVQPVATLVGIRPGRTRLLVTGVHTAADTLPKRQPFDSVLVREVIVTARPVERAPR